MSRNGHFLSGIASGGVVHVPIAELDNAHLSEFDTRGRKGEKGYSRRVKQSQREYGRPDAIHPTDHPDKMDALTQDIAKNGVREPLLVEKGRFGSVHVLNGNHRYIAAKRAGVGTVPVKLR